MNSFDLKMRSAFLVLLASAASGSAFALDGPQPGVSYLYRTMHFWNYWDTRGIPIDSTFSNTAEEACLKTIGVMNGLPESESGDYFLKENWSCGPHIRYLNITHPGPQVWGERVASIQVTCRPKPTKPTSCERDGYPKAKQPAYPFQWIAFPVLDRVHCKPCLDKIGNPIAPMLASKHMTVELGVGANPETVLTYDSRQYLPTVDTTPVFSPRATPSFGDAWNSALHKSIVVQTIAPSSTALHVARGSGIWTSFSKTGATYVPDADVADEVVDAASGWRYKDVVAAAFESFNSEGLLVAKSMANGRSLTYQYSNESTPPEVAPQKGLMIAVTDQFGRRTDFTYALVSGVPRVRSMTSGGLTTWFEFGPSLNLDSIRWPDQKVRSFLYERSDIPWALTGIWDEEGARNATYQYDALGRAFDTQRAHGADHYTVSWTSAPRLEVKYSLMSGHSDRYWRDTRWTTPAGTSITLPGGQSVAWVGTDVQGTPRVTSREQPAGSGCEPSASSLSYDIRGNVTTKVDFNHVRSCHAYAASRKVESFRLEGLSETDSCPADLANAQADSNKAQRKISTLWHPLWQMEVRRAEPKRITTTVYNGEADPLDNNTVATCVAGDPRLPDNSRLAVVCTRYEQSTDDETGNLGFSAVEKERRKSSFTYNQYGQVLSETDPRGKVTTYDYWTDTSFTGTGNAARGHQLGDLKSVTNSLRQKTDHLDYNNRGQVLTTRYANGSQEQREYHVRGWLAKSTLVPAGSGAGQVTQYGYYDTGLLKKVTQPDGSFAKYTWDDAQRLTDVTDSVGNTVHYDLDGLGNRTAEKFKDPQGTLAKTISRTFDALGRMSSSTGLQ
jgi:YD repeat-containing protein